MSKAEKHLSMIGLYWQNHGKKDRPILAHDTTRYPAHIDNQCFCFLN